MKMDWKPILKMAKLSDLKPWMAFEGLLLANLVDRQLQTVSACNYDIFTYFYVKVLEA